ncbi:FecCD family ABC transporter permease [Catenovulum maritimum]|uniref:ABC transporter permease n=1 Tax=Catenovulum maritimum TaxID=1513271 RepID=A0A0J8GR84_9ALTE|nr:iron ABC transporter permease [Catenovulum maritimum]KMT65340.1 ABC transporter permease [Catenovulum maritimum]
MFNASTQVKIIFGLIGLLVSFFVSLFFGSAELSIQQVSACLINDCDSQMIETLIWQIRMPRVLVAVLCGMGLAVAGAILQNTTRNPLAEPYLFGVVSGAGLGASIVSLWFSHSPSFVLPLVAFFGALAAILIVVTIHSISKKQQIASLLLSGVAVSFMFSAISQFILFVGDPFAANRVIFWLMGSLSRVENQHLVIIAPVVIACISLVYYLHRQLDALMLGEENALTMGINVKSLRYVLLALCAALTAILVSFCGGIGFVGLMIPHIARQIFGVTSAKLITGCIIIGSIFLIWVDVIARVAVKGQEIPIGVITSVIGSLFFISLMLKK